ncbi:MAG: hypothetical protein AAF196_02060 [Planctomycetota bacterium]
MRALPAFAVLLTVVLSGCNGQSVESNGGDDQSSGTEAVALELVKSDVAKAYPFHRYGADLYLAGLPSEADFRSMAEAGVRTICDLCDVGERGRNDPEPDLVRELGMEFLHCPMGGDTGHGDPIFDEGRRILREAERPLVMHCQSSNRVGAVFLTWCILDEGIDQDTALDLARRSGLSSSFLEGRALEYVAAHRGD